MPGLNSLLPGDEASSLGAFGGVAAHEKEVTRSRDLFFVSLPGGNCDERTPPKKERAF